jgi:hypothetical protein
MNEHSKMHVYLDWAKERLDEIDATLASFEASIAHQGADVRHTANSALSQIRKSRDAFRQKIKDEKDATDAAWTKAKTLLEVDWKTFESGVEAYLESVGHEVALREAAFKARADAQQKSWHEAMGKFDKAVTKLATGGKAELEIALKKMKSEADVAKASLERLRGARDQSWSALKTALAETRAAFDRADHAVHEAFKRAA